MLQINESSLGKCYKQYKLVVPSVMDAQERNNGSEFLLDAVGVSLSNSSFVGAEAAENTSSKYLPTAIPRPIASTGFTY